MSQLTPMTFRDRTDSRRDALYATELEESTSFRPGRTPPTPSLLADYLRTLARWRISILLAAVLVAC